MSGTSSGQVTRELRPAWVFFLVVAGIAVILALLRTKQELRPEVERVFIAIAAEPDDVARVGAVEVEVGAPFRLHAVVEATDWRGRTVFYTEARTLELPTGIVPDEQLRSWDRQERVRILWFTVEGAPPYREVATPADLEGPRFREVFQADWPQTWSVPGRLDPTVENFLPGTEQRGTPLRFGTQRFHVRIEFFSERSDLLPADRLRSPGAVDLEAAAQLPQVSATLEPPLSAVSRFFGLPQIEPSSEASPEVSAALAVLTERGLAFNRLQVLRSWLNEVGVGWEDLSWLPVELNAEAAWTRGAAVRAGSKVAFTYDDRGVPGRLDKADLCLDFDKGATVRTLGEIFVGEGLVELTTAELLADQ